MSETAAPAEEANHAGWIPPNKQVPLGITLIISQPEFAARHRLWRRGAVGPVDKAWTRRNLLQDQGPASPESSR